MEINTNVCSNELRKIGMLIIKASDLGMDVSGYGSADINKWSGNVYLWLEDYQLTLYIGLNSDEIFASWFHPETGEETDVKVGNMTLTDLENWANDLNNQSEGVTQ
jgi:hypothetical protein